MSFFVRSDSTVRAGRVWLVVLAVILLGPLMWGLSVVTADLWGRGEVVRQVNDPNNRIFAQEYFEELYADVLGYAVQIQVVAATVEADPTNDKAATDLQGLRLICIDTVQTYNAEARKVTSERFRLADLPYQLNPEVECP